MKTIDEIFLEYLDKGEYPFDYERSILKEHFSRILAIYDGKSVPPYEIEIQPSSTCNVRCKWCIGHNVFNKLPNLLDDVHMERICNEFLNYDEAGFRIKVIKFSGFVGEPLMNPATITGLETCLKKNIRVGLFTNGMLLDKKKESGQPYLDIIAHVSYVHLSLDSGSDKSIKLLKGKHASFKKIMDNLDMLIEKKKELKSSLEINIGYIITPENYFEIYDTARMLKAKGATAIRFKLDITGRKKLKELAKNAIEQIKTAKLLSDANFKVVSIHQEEEFCDLENKAYFTNKNLKCFTSKLWGTLGSDGYLHICDHRAHSKGGPYGDLKEKSFKEIWTSNSRIEISESLPDKYCTVCSPFASRINEFLTFLFNCNREDIIRLYETYIQNNKKK